MRFPRPTFVLHLAVLVGLILLLSCSTGERLTDPGLDDLTIENQAVTINHGRHLWGFWDISINPDTLEVGINPVRGAMFNANIVLFMQPPSAPTHMLSVNIDLTDSEIENYLVAVDVTLRHPFPGLNQYRGFDVRGIFIADGSQTAGFDPSAAYANWFDAAPGVPTSESVLLNADGYTRWWNPGEFTSVGTVLGYTQGALATPGFTGDATVNPFKYFTDSLGPEDPFEIDPATRGSFATTPGINTRRYLIQFDGSPLQFSYAVDASWVEPDPMYAPDYPLEAWDENANTKEAYNLTLADAGSTAWYVDAIENGGTFTLDVEVFDWQADSLSSVLTEISSIWVDSPAFDDGAGNNYVDVLTGTYEILNGTNETSAVFRFDVLPNFETGGITEPGQYPVLIGVQSADPDSYEPQIDGGGGAFDYPDAPLTALATGIVNVLDEDPNPQPDVVLIFQDPVSFPANAYNFHAYSPAVVVENDGDICFAYAEWNGVSGDSYAAVFRSHDDGSTWPDWRWNQHTTAGNGSHTGDTIKVWPSSHNLSYQTYNLTSLDESTLGAGHASGTFPDGPNGSEKANNFNSAIDNASEIIQDAEHYVYFFGDSGGQISFKRSVTPECLNCAPGTFNWSGYPTFLLVNPGRVSRVRSSSLYSGVMYLAYFEPAGNIIRLASSIDGNSWDTSAVVWDGAGSDTIGARDPGLLIDSTGYHVTFVRNDLISGNDEVCYSYSSNGTTWSTPVEIYEGTLKLQDTPITRYDWESYSVLATVWWEGDNIMTSYSLDDGATWTEPVLVSVQDEQNKHADLWIAPTGNWHFVFSNFNDGTTYWEIVYRRAHLEFQ